jgi:hypothetical protein
MLERCRGADDNPGLELGLALGAGCQEGRDKVAIRPSPHGFGLWVEQLVAESTGKDGKGLVPLPEEPSERRDVQVAKVRLDAPEEIGSEFFRFELATAVAGAILRVNPFDQPNVQEAKDRTNALLEAGRLPALQPEGSLDELLARAEESSYLAIQAFIDPGREPELEPLVARAREAGLVVTVGLGPRYLHSTGQLHKGGPPTGLFLQVVDDFGDEVPVPGRKLGFRRLIAAQALGDYEALKERGRPVARIRLEEGP